MDAWIDRLAQTLGEDPLGAPEVEALLETARDVAHGVERRVTPLSAFLAGIAVGRRPATESRDVALARVLAEVRRLVEGETGRSG